MNSKKAGRSDDADAFIRESDQKAGTSDDLAEHLAEQYLEEVNGADDVVEESRDELLQEDLGGPFVVTRPQDEFGDTKPRTKVDSKEEPNPLPQAVGSLAIASANEEIEAAETRREQGDREVELVDPDAEIESRLEPDVHELERTNHIP